MYKYKIIELTKPPGDDEKEDDTNATPKPNLLGGVIDEMSLVRVITHHKFVGPHVGGMLSNFGLYAGNECDIFALSYKDSQEKL